MKGINFLRLNLYTVFRDLLYNWWVILLALITGFVGSVSYYAFLFKPDYVSSMTISINLSGYTSEATALSLARTVEITKALDDVFQSNALKDVVEKAMGEPLTGTIHARQIEETNLVEIYASDKSPEKAYDTLVAVYDNYPKVTDYVFTNIIIRAIVNPTMPSGISGIESYFGEGVLFAVICAMLAVIVIFALSFFRDTVKNIADVENELDIKLFGVINRVRILSKRTRKEKCKFLVTNPLIGFNTANSFLKMAVRLESLKRTKAIQAVMITSVTENEGKTSTSVNLAVTLAQNGHKVLLMDADLKHPSTQYFFSDISNQEESNFSKLLALGGNVEDYIRKDSETGVHILCNTTSGGGSAELLSGTVFTGLISKLKETFDFIIIDTPPCGITVDAEIIANSADGVLLVVRQDVVAVSDINDHIQEFEKNNVLGCIFNDVADFDLKAKSLHNDYYSQQSYGEGGRL